MRDVEFIRPTEGAVVIAFHGYHDLMTREELRDCLAHEIASNERVIVDVSDAKFIDSSFLHNLEVAYRLARESGSRLVLEMDSVTHTRKVVEVSRVLRDLDWADSQDAALRLPPSWLRSEGLPVG
jgi:anti-anti-sigma regulatory factor